MILACFSQIHNQTDIRIESALTHIPRLPRGLRAFLLLGIGDAGIACRSLHNTNPPALEILHHRPLVSARPVEHLVVTRQLAALVEFLVAGMAGRCVQCIVRLDAPAMPVFHLVAMRRLASVRRVSGADIVNLNLAFMNAMRQIEQLAVAVGEALVHTFIQCALNPRAQAIV